MHLPVKIETLKTILFSLTDKSKQEMNVVLICRRISYSAANALLSFYLFMALYSLSRSYSPLVALVYIMQWQYTLQLNNVSIPNHIATALSVEIERDLNYQRTLQWQCTLQWKRLKIFERLEFLKDSPGSPESPRGPLSPPGVP